MYHSKTSFFKTKDRRRSVYTDPRLHVPDVLKRYLDIKAADVEEEKTILRLEKRAPVTSRLKSEREALQMKLKEIAFKYHSKNNRQLQMLSELPSLTLLNANLSNFYFKEEFENLDENFQEDEFEEFDEEANSIFKKVPHNFSAFIMWRSINNTLEFIPNVWMHENTFYNDLGYLIYVATEIGQTASPDMIPRKIKKKFTQIHIHYWVGENVEKADASFLGTKAIELCNYVKNAASLHRESQLNETPRFKGYFRNKGLRIIQGPYVPNGLRFNIRPALFRLQGHGTTILYQFSHVSWKFLNSSEVFLLLAKNILFVWFGSSSSMLEKLNGIRMANSIQEETEDISMCFVDDGREQALGENEKQIFDETLHLNKRHVSPYKDETDICVADRLDTPIVKFYQCQQAHGTVRYKFTEYAAVPLHSTILRKKHVYLIDEAPRRVWMWCGSNVFFDDRDDAIRNARGFIKKKGYASTIPITVVHEYYEFEEFKLLFQVWSKSNEEVTTLNLSTLNSEILLERPYLTTELQLIDSGNGRLKMYRVSDNKLGSESSYEDKQFGIRSMYEKDADLKAKGAMLVKIYQGHEPPHFLQLFQGKFTVFNRYYTELDIATPAAVIPRKYLLEVTGAMSYNAIAIQIPIDASKLNSNKCFLLKSSEFFVWCGRHTTGDEREVAKNLAPTDYNLVFEGFESNEFWEEFGERKIYDQIQKVYRDKNVHIPSFYHCYSVNGQILCEPVIFYNQTHFSPYNVILLDFVNVLYIWIGEKISAPARKMITELSDKFLKYDNKMRSLKTCVVVVKQRHEPILFQGFFENWDLLHWDKQVSYMSLRQELEITQEELTHRKSHVPSHESVEHFDNYPKYPNHVLTGSLHNMPTEVDVAKKEMHLTADDFRAIFGMDYTDFAVLPKWKQEILKKLKDLF